MKIKLKPIFKYAGNSGDRLWWNRIESGDSFFKVAYPIGVTFTTCEDMPEIKMIKFFVGPVCFGIGWATATQAL